MEQKDFDIYEILKGMPDGTKLYTPMCGKVAFSYLATSKGVIRTEGKNGDVHCFDKNGRWTEGGEVLLFPSKEMRDWSKFFKKGDVLEYVGCVDVKGNCIFEKYEDDTKIRFLGRFVKENEVLSPNRSATFRTADWGKSDDPAGYIRFVEERLGGKLNRETLEIEKTKKPVFEIGKLYVFNEEDEDGNVTVIGELIGKYESNDMLRFGNQYEIETEKLVTDQAFDLNISLHEELREATENEIELFEKHYSIWTEKEAREHPDFKPFDKVLVRIGKRRKWQPAFFICDRGEEIYRYKVLSIQSGTVTDFPHCIPFEGNENIAFTDYDIEYLPF